MRLSPIRLNALLNDMGQLFLWRKGFVCPCVNPKSGQPRIDCQNCDGRGVYWGSGVKGAAAAIGRTALKKIADFGMWDAGDMAISLPSDSLLYGVGINDRLTALNRTEPFSQNFVYGINDRLKFIPTQIDSVTWFDENNDLVVGDIPSINALNQLVWSGNAPPLKTTYALTGRRMPEYYAYLDLTIDRPHHYGRALPRRIQLRRLELFGN